VTDAIYGWLLLHEGYTPGSGALEAGWALFYILLGAAALHASMRTVSDRQPEVDTRVSMARLVFLGGACLLAPATQAFAEARGQDIDLTVVLWATIVLFVLAVVRMGGLVRQHEQSALRERAMRQAGSALVTATSREQIFEATIEAARTAAGERSILRMLTRTDDALTVAAVSGGADVTGFTHSIGDLEPWKRARLDGGDSYQVPSAEARHRNELDLPASDATVLVVPLLVRDELHAVMLVAVPGQIGAAIMQTIEALAAQAALALDSAMLTEELLLKQSEARFASLVRNASDVVTVVEIDSTITYASPSSQRTLGYTSERSRAARGSSTSCTMRTRRGRCRSSRRRPTARGLTATLEFRLRRRDGSFIYAETQRTNLLHDPNVHGIVLTHQAFHDSLTGLANRALFPTA
jgi:PAS domain S-box-containing protein